MLRSDLPVFKEQIMRRRLPVIAIGFVMVMSGPVVAQEKPDFSGTWALLDNPQLQLQITQDGSRLTISERGTRLTFYLDGSDSQNTNKAPNGNVWLHVSQAKWISSAVVITTRTSSETLPNWTPFTMLTTYSL